MPRRRRAADQPPPRDDEPSSTTSPETGRSRRGAGPGQPASSPESGAGAPAELQPIAAVAPVESVERLEPEPAVAPIESWLPLLEDRSPNPWVCPFLRSVGTDGAITAPIESPDPANRCAALRGEAVPQSLRQQELVCLTSGHTDCPRYLRGAVVISEPVKPQRTPSGLTPAILASLAVLVVAFTASVAFLLARGGLELQGVAGLPGPSPTAVAVASPTTAPSVAPSLTPSVVPSSTVEPSPSIAVSPSPTETPVPSASPSSSATPRSDRFALLTQCTGRSNCWIYTIRRGDNLFSIARYFGVSMDAIHRLNPWTQTRGIRAGQQLIIPTPTR